ncbi:MAG: hypothetical protein FJY73_07810 [Candidatus Eisenbacteria bacterium]|nr:hypothetical protein [Candidatus Eisenbacteria bacterium]
METRERQREETAAIRTGAPGDGGGGDLASLREAGAHLLRAGDEAIRKVLSMDSEKFLEATRQEGGE